MASTTATVDAQSPANPEIPGRAPAPGSLELVRAFLNSVDLEAGEEDLTTPASLGVWLIRRGLLPAGTQVDTNDLADALALREAIRDVLGAHTGHPVDRGANARLDRIAAGVPLRIRFSDGAHLKAEGAGIEVAIGRLLAAIHEGMNTGTWERLKVCRSRTCRWAFYDASRNQSGAWCSMAACGNRMKGRAFRSRRRAEA
ncbi:MAG TPA: CGNR zinc finger domain-containing protein [Candidatus Limnocylindria bacterium]|nr:CGNR zinc finger domain-containing protein [Candidatus Limnocylindria bacterium]